MVRRRLALVLGAEMLLAALDASAGGRGGSGGGRSHSGGGAHHGHGHHHHGGAVFFGGLFYSGPYYYAPGYHPYYSVPVYGPPDPYWSYCRPANAYYPYVRECPGGWERYLPSPESPLG
jgi:hypothetical protein